MLNEYNKDQVFHDDGVDEQFEAKEKAKPSKKKIKKRQKLEDLISQADKEDRARDVVSSMRHAADADLEAIKNNKPAFHKLQILKDIMYYLQQKVYQEAYLNCDLCGAIESWLQPLPNNQLCNKNIRQNFYKLLEVLPIEEKHLIESGIGKMLIRLANHKDETFENRVTIKRIVEKWMRPIFHKTSNYRTKLESNFDTVDKTGEDEEDETEAHRRRKRKAKKKKRSGDAIGNRMAKQKREPQPGEPGFTWYAKLPKKMNLSGLKRVRKSKISAKKAAKSKVQHDISRKLVQMRQKSKAKSADLRPVKVSVQGRGL